VSGQGTSATRPGGIRVTYIGHATLLLELTIGERRTRLLTDPNWDPSLGSFLRRVTAPGVAIDALPRLDAILLTHAHADHLSFDSLEQLATHHPEVPVFAPPAVARWLRKRGHANAAALAPDEHTTIGGARVVAATARHLGARYAVDRWRAAANMYLIDTNSAAIFFAGDTALTPEAHRLVAQHVHATRRRLDLALLPIGHPPWWKRASFRKGHLTPDDALTLFEQLDARIFVPYHWGTFNHVTSSAYDAIDQLRRDLETHRRAEDVRILEPGATLELEQHAT
jgi:L-ascorbate metabolism protein UlaG (beta-lactamase superfamily)